MLAMNNSGYHPPKLKEACTNIKIMFPPPNTTSWLQPLNPGIIQNFKIHYRELFLQFECHEVCYCSSGDSLGCPSMGIGKRDNLQMLSKNQILDKSIGIASRVDEDQGPFDE